MALLLFRYPEFCGAGIGIEAAQWPGRRCVPLLLVMDHGEEQKRGRFNQRPLLFTAVASEVVGHAKAHAAWSLPGQDLAIDAGAVVRLQTGSLLFVQGIQHVNGESQFSVSE